MQWWSKYYSKPLKDPTLSLYTLEELAYEYYLVNETVKAEAEALDAQSDKIEEAKDQAAAEWADQMEAEEGKDEKEGEDNAPPDPSLDPANVEWMQQEIEKNKAELGDDFGEDLGINFEE